MDHRKWFVFVDGMVKGPFEKIDLESRLTAWHNPLIWGRGQTDWVPPDRWSTLLKNTDNLLKPLQNQPERLWRVRIGEKELKPMNHIQMTEYLKTRKDLSDVLLWTEGYEEWKEVYQIHKIMDELGVSRRAHPRVPIMGTLECEGTSAKFTGRLLSISEGGLGITEAPKLKIGEKLKVLLKSPNLPSSIKTAVEVVFIGQDGYAGMKFHNLPTDSKSLVIEYVKKFAESKP